jgi:hypothetical protein
MRKNAQVGLRLHASLKAAAEEAAREDLRSLTGFIEKVLTEYLKARAHERGGCESAPHG